MPTACLKVGVLATTSMQMGEFVRLVQTAGHRACASIDASVSLPQVLPEVDAWLVASNYPESAKAFLERLDAANAPIVFEDDALVDDDAELSPHDLRVQRARRLASKLHFIAQGDVRDRANDNLARAKYVWVLAASTGGPKAVADFLDGIPEELAGVAFLYVQHINDDTMQTLKQVVTKHSAFDVYMLDTPRVIREKTLYLIPPSTQIDLLDNGVITPLGKPWQGDYSPSIDQVIAKVARIFASRGGAIIFTGMGDDGASSSKLLHYRGGEVWVQSTDSCAVDSMPASVLATMGDIEQGAPHELAKKLVARYAQVSALLNPAEQL